MTDTPDTSPEGDIHMNEPERILAWTVNEWGSAWSVAPEDAAPEALEYVRSDLCDPMQDYRVRELVDKAHAVIDRWDSTDWKAPPTADAMNELRDALRDMGGE